jgi:hypothetical protein
VEVPDSLTFAEHGEDYASPDNPDDPRDLRFFMLRICSSENSISAVFSCNGVHDVLQLSFCELPIDMRRHRNDAIKHERGQLQSSSDMRFKLHQPGARVPDSLRA